MGLFRIERAGESRVPGQIGEEDRRLPTLTRRRRSERRDARSTKRAKARPARQSATAFDARIASGNHDGILALFWTLLCSTKRTADGEGETLVKDASLPITLIVIGILGLVWYFRWLPDIDWIIS